MTAAGAGPQDLGAATHRPGFGRFADGTPVGDVIPFFDEDAGDYHLFVLAPPPGALYYPPRLRTSWRHLVSRDLISWEELPTALAPGDADGIDGAGIWTGSVIKHDDTWYAFYTGVGAGASQTVCLATSNDGIAWRRHEGNPVCAPGRPGFEKGAWRDPYVSWDRRAARFRMLLTARTEGPAAAGVVLELTSRDVTCMEDGRVAHEPFLTHAPECPERFSLDGRWVLGYSTYTGAPGTAYQVADEESGPWLGPVSRPDGAYFYAAKGLSDASGRRVVFGWVPDRDPVPANPANPWLWGGDLALPRELRLAEDGRVVTRPAAELAGLLGVPVSAGAAGPEGPWRKGATVDAVRKPAVQVLTSNEPLVDFVFTASFAPGSTATALGVVVCTNANVTDGLGIFFSPGSGSVQAVDMAGRTALSNTEFAGLFGSYSPVVSNTVSSRGQVDFEVYVRGEVVEAFVSSECCLTYRIHRTPRCASVATLVAGGTARPESIDWRHLTTLRSDSGAPTSSIGDA